MQLLNLITLLFLTLKIILHLLFLVLVGDELLDEFIVERPDLDSVSLFRDKLIKAPHDIVAPLLFFLEFNDSGLEFCYFWHYFLVEEFQVFVFRESLKVLPYALSVLLCQLPAYPNLHPLHLLVHHLQILQNRVNSLVQSLNILTYLLLYRVNFLANNLLELLNFFVELIFGGF